MEWNHRSRWAAGAICAGVLCGAAEPAHAQESEPTYVPVTDDLSPWRFETEVYAPVPVASTTDLAIGDRMATIDGDAADIGAIFRAGFSMRLEGWYRRYGLVLDGSYIEVANSEDLPGGTSVGASARGFDLDILGGVRAFEYAGDEPWPSVGLELYGGIRGGYDEARISIGELMSDEQDASLKLAGAIEVPVRLTERWWLRARTTVAFLQGTSLEVLAYAEYNFDPVALGFGYQYDLNENDSDRLTIESDAHNIYLSFVLRFTGEG